MQWWYNVSTGQVESDDERGMGEDMLGPYATKEQAAHALEAAHEKTEKWDAEDREWANRGASASWSAEPADGD